MCRVVRDGEKHHIVEYTVRGESPNRRNEVVWDRADRAVLLEGVIETSYTKADNSPVVATDTSEPQLHFFRPCER